MKFVGYFYSQLITYTVMWYIVLPLTLPKESETADTHNNYYLVEHFYKKNCLNFK